MLRSGVFAAGVVVFVGGCAGSVNGEIDGKSVGNFYSAAFGLGELDAGEVEAVSIFGLALPGNSCDDGTEVLDQSLDSGGADPDDAVDLINERIPVDHWFATLQVSAEDESDFRDESVELDDEDPDVRVSLALCFQKKEAKVRNDAVDDGSDCFGATDGDVNITFDGNRLGVASDDEVKFEDEDGDTAGRVTFNLGFSACESMSSTLQDAFDDLLDGQNNPPPPSEGEGEGGPGDECEFADDGECDEPSLCDPGTDTTDCG
jgi:hypothetical protein